MFNSVSDTSLALFGDSELIAILLKAAVILLLCGLMRRYFPFPKPDRKPDAELPHLTDFRRTNTSIRPSAREWTLLVLITALYAMVSLHRLGSPVMPHTIWQPVQTPQSITLELYEDTLFDRIMIFAGEGDNNARTDGYQFGLNEFTIEVSDDLASWETAAVLNEQRYYQYIDTFGYWNKRYVRLTSSSDADAVTEIAFVNNAMQKVLPVRVLEDPCAESTYPADRLIDEQAAVTADNTYYDESYFDEVYHPRNAWEIAEGQYMYASVHPLLGTQMIALSIKLFGNNPLAWRLPGALTGILMVPLLWYLIRLLSKRAEPALLGAALFACDFMHITTSRIATLEPMSVCAILVMFIFMVRWVNTSFFDRPLSASLRELLFCGIATGIGFAIKWTACYSAVGLALIYAYSMLQRYGEYRRLKLLSLQSGGSLNKDERSIIRRAKQFPTDFRKTILWSFLFFIGIPLVIYFLAYIPCHITRDGWSLKTVADQIRYMYEYHINLDATHPYQSTWNQWLLDERPVWYYSKEDLSGAYHTIACFTNPLLSLAGLFTALFTFADAALTRKTAPVVISIGYLTALAPWFMVDRCVFAYHFYPTSIFMIASIAWCFYRLVSKRPSLKWLPGLFAALVLIVFIIWLPVITGFGTTRDMVHILEIIPSWYFG